MRLRIRNRIPARRALVLAAAASALLSTLGAPRPAAAQRLPFTRYQTDDGLAATQVWHVMQDRRGILWVSTTWGLNRFDGNSFSTLSVSDGLPSPTARLALEDDTGNLWIGTNAGLARYDGVAIESFAGRGGAFAATTWSAGKDRNGALWFGTDRGLISYVGGEFHTFTTADGLASDYVYGLLLASDGSVWLGSRGAGVSRCTLERGGRLGHCRVFTTRDGLAGNSVHSIVEGPGGALFIATRDGGISRFDGKTFTTLGVNEGLPSKDVYALMVHGGELLVGTDNGMALCALPSGSPCRIWRESNGLPDDGVRCFLVDREGTLWIGAEGGLARLDRRDVYSYAEPEGLPDGHVYALAPDGGSGVWIGTFNGLAHLEVGIDGAPKTRVWRIPDGLPANWVWSLLRDRDGRLWVGTEHGLALMTADGRFETWTVADGLSGDYISGLLQDRQGAIWTAATEGVSRLEPASGGGRPRITGFHVEDGLPSPRATALAEDAQGRIWVAHSESLSYFDGTRFHSVGLESGLASRSTRSFGSDREGNLWVGGQEQVARLLPGPPDSPPRFLPLDAGGALDDFLVLSIAENDRGELVLGTNRGVLILNRHGEKAELIGRFDRSTGALASEVSHSSAFTRDSAGRFWFGFKGGATVFVGDLEPTAARQPPEVAFERLSTGSGRDLRAPFNGVQRREAPLLDGLRVELPHTERTIRVETRARSLSSREALRYQFRLDGLEKNWSEARPESIREYVELEPGEYRLEARARFAEGEWGPVAELAVKLVPAWYETRLARLLALLLGGTLIFGAAHLRTLQVAARNRALASEVAARTDDLARYARALEEHVHALGRANERIRLADRHRGEFLAKMSHELRAPLTSVLGFAALLGDGLEGAVDARFLRYVTNIRESGNHLLRLINNLLDQAKIEAGRMDLHLERASVDSVVESALSLVEGFAATRSVKLQVERRGELPPVTVDVAKLRQVVINLLSNAIKFAPAASEVEIRLGLHAGPAPGAPAAYEIVVADRGPGIDPDEHERIFEPFRQVSASGQSLPGTGLGLPIVRQFVELLGGTVTVATRPGGGAEFAVVLPISAAERPALDGRPATPAAEPGGDRPRVLVIEPDRGRFTALASHLDRRGFLAVRAPDAEEGIRMLRELHPSVVAIDIDPSRTDAWAVLTALEREHLRNDLPWVLFAFASGSERGIAVGLDRAFVGPAPIAGLAAAVVGSIERRAARTESATVWIAADGASVSEAFDAALERVGLSVCRLPPRAQALAEAAAGGFDAVVIEIGDERDPDSGGFDLALAAQTSLTAPMAWVGLLPAQLAAADRRRLLELASDASAPAGDAVARSVERLVGRR